MDVRLPMRMSACVASGTDFGANRLRAIVICRTNMETNKMTRAGHAAGNRPGRTSPTGHGIAGMFHRGRAAAFALALALAFASPGAGAQSGLRRIYDETLDPMSQIDGALKAAKSSDRFVICQVGGNWCPWCLKFADFIGKDEEIAKEIEDNYVYVHVNYNPRQSGSEKQVRAAQALMKRLGWPARFGFPVLVVLGHKGEVVHIQDSGFLESGDGYDRDKVLRFLTSWTPSAVGGPDKRLR